MIFASPSSINACSRSESARMKMAFSREVFASNKTPILQDFYDTIIELVNEINKKS